MGHKTAESLSSNISKNLTNLAPVSVQLSLSFIK